MLRKLVEISLGRQGRTTDTGLPTTMRGSNASQMLNSGSQEQLQLIDQDGSPPPKKQRKNTMASIKSMHVGSRKKELQRIEKENFKIAQKIFAIKPHHSARQDMMEYQKTRHVSQNLQKIKRKNYDGLVLPPIRGQTT